MYYATIYETPDGTHAMAVFPSKEHWTKAQVNDNRHHSTNETFIQLKYIDFMENLTEYAEEAGNQPEPKPLPDGRPVREGEW